MIKANSKNTIFTKAMAIILAFLIGISSWIGVTPVTTDAAANAFVIDGRDVIKEAIGFLGTKYNIEGSDSRKTKHYTAAYTYSGGSFAGYNTSGDCSGLVYATLMNLGLTIHRRR